MAQTLFVQMVRNVTSRRTLETSLATKVLRNSITAGGRVGIRCGGNANCRLFSSVTPEAMHSWQAKLWSVGRYCSARLTLLAVLFSKQCNAIAAQRIRRSMQIVNLYVKLGYDKRSIQKIVERFSSRWPQGKGRRLYFIFGAIGFSWDKEKITDEEINRPEEFPEICAYMTDESENIIKSAMDEFHLVQSNPNDRLECKMMPSWQSVINQDHLKVWRKPLPHSGGLYEYKVFGRYRDIPPQAFFHAQVDLGYRKTWDKLVIKLEVVDRDDKTSCEIVQWVMHFPYPMYGREYVYIRKQLIDEDNQMMVLMSHSIDHPSCPITSEYVRVDTYLSQMVIKSHTKFDENGFDYILTYYDNPKGHFPSIAYNWMASTGVPDFVDKMHQSAKQLHEQKKKKKPVTGRQTADDDDRQDNKGGDKVPIQDNLFRLLEPTTTHQDL